MSASPKFILSSTHLFVILKHCYLSCYIPVQLLCHDLLFLEKKKRERERVIFSINSQGPPNLKHKFSDLGTPFLSNTNTQCQQKYPRNWVQNTYSCSYTFSLYPVSLLIVDVFYFLIFPSKACPALKFMHVSHLIQSIL